MKIKDKILIIEDETSISSFIATVLAANNYDTMIAHTGSEAITRVSEQESISGADALARLLAGRDALGWVGSAVTELTLGYLPSENAGTGMRFVPVWRIETDAGSFYVNGITREITPL